MNYYPPEAVTRPLALAALLGRPDLHAAAREFLRSSHNPPINSIGKPSFTPPPLILHTSTI